MKIYAVATNEENIDMLVSVGYPYLLVSFFFLQKGKSFFKKVLTNVSHFTSIFVDSGAYTFFKHDVGMSVDDFANAYIDFLGQHEGWISEYIELDLDPIGVEYSKVVEWRERMTERVGRPPIPVWHKIRGIAEWENMCKSYSYVGLSSDKGIPKQVLRKMTIYARKRGCKVHGFGITKTDYMLYIPYTSVDSSTWVNGARYGYIPFTNAVGKVKHYKKGLYLGALAFKRLQLQYASLWEGEV